MGPAVTRFSGVPTKDGRVAWFPAASTCFPDAAGIAAGGPTRLRPASTGRRLGASKRPHSGTDCTPPAGSMSALRLPAGRLLNVVWPPDQRTLVAPALPAALGQPLRNPGSTHQSRVSPTRADIWRRKEWRRKELTDRCAATLSGELNTQKQQNSERNLVQVCA